jgi:hypothetical protein
VANFVFNISKGRAGTMFQNVKDNSPAGCKIVVVPIQTAGLEAAATAKDHDTLALFLAGTSDEQVTMGRKDVIAAGLTLTVDDTNDLLKVDMADQTWTGATRSAISGLVIAYSPGAAILTLKNQPSPKGAVFTRAGLPGRRRSMDPEAWAANSPPSLISDANCAQTSNFVIPSVIVTLKRAPSMES